MTPDQLLELLPVVLGAPVALLIVGGIIGDGIANVRRRFAEGARDRAEGLS